MELKLIRDKSIEKERTCDKCARVLSMDFFQANGENSWFATCKGCYQDPRTHKQYVCRRCKVRQAISSFDVDSTTAKRKLVCRACYEQLVPVRKTNETTRVCCDCKTEHPIESFAENRLRENRIVLSRRCVVCRRRVSRNATRKYMQSSLWRNEPTKRLLMAIRSRAKNAGIPFDLVAEDLFIPEFCPVLGIRLKREPGNTSFPDESLSVDRLVPELGYIRGNITVMSGRANRLKSNGTAEEHERVAAWMRSQGLP